MRKFCVGSASHCDFLAEYWTTVLDVETTQEFFSNLASGSWMRPLRDMLELLQDTLVLRRCGFKLDADFAKQFSPTSPEVALEDAKTQRFLAYMLGILRHRVSRHSCVQT